VQAVMIPTAVPPDIHAGIEPGIYDQMTDVLDKMCSSNFTRYFLDSVSINTVCWQKGINK
jgi:hypothetical protein